MLRFGSASTRRSLAVLVDQALSSASNFLLVILVARSLSTADFGTFAIAFSCLTLGLGLARANLGVPLSIDLTKESDPRSVDETVGRATAVALLTGALIGVLVAGIALLFASEAELRTPLLVLAVSSPFLVTQDVARYVAVAQGVQRRAAVSDLAWVLVGAAVLVAGQIGGHQNAAVAAGGWVAGGLLGLVLLRSCLRPPMWRGTLRWFGGDRRRHHLTVDALTAAVAPLVVVSLVAAIVSPAVVGSLRGASTLMSPVNVAIAAISLGAVAEIRRRPWDGAVRFMVALSVGLAACALVSGLVVWAMPASVGGFLLGDTWSSAKAVLPFTTAEFIALAVWNGAVALLRASGRTRVSAGLRVCYLVIAVVAATGAAWTTGTARGVQFGLAASAALIAIATWTTVARQGQMEAAVSVVESKSG